MTARRRFALPRPLAELIPGELERLGPATRPLEATRRWADAVGPTVARNAWPARAARDGTLVVHTSSSVWAHELTQLAEEIRPRLGPDPPARLRFVVGPIPDAPARAVSEDPARPERAPQITAQELGEARRLAARIDDQELREAVSGAIANALARARSDRPV